jgi:tight adherence protein B
VRRLAGAIVFLTIALSSTCGVAALASAAGAATESLRVVSVDVDAAPQVTLTVALPPSFAGRPLSDGDFEARESGKRRPVRVTGLPSDPLDVVLVIDTSGSMRGAPLDSAKAAAQAFLAELPAAVRVSIIGFGDRPYQAIGFTGDRGALAAAIANLEARGETALYDAVDAGLAALTGSAHHAMVVLSDGKDTSSQTGIDAVSGNLALRKVSFYGVALQSPEADLTGLDRVAAAAGGTVVPATDPVKLSDAYRSVGAELSSLYRVTFPTTGSGSTGFAVSVRDGDRRATGSARASLPVRADQPPEPARVRTEIAPDPGLAGEGWVLAAGLVALFLGLVAAVALLAVPREGRSQLSTGRRVRTGGSRITALADQATNLAERSLERTGKNPGLDRALEQAGIAMRPAEFVVLVAAVAFAIFVGGLLLTNFLVGIVLAAVALLGCRLLLQQRARRRRRRFGDQLEQTLPLMASSLRAGFGLLQAVDAVARESEAPTAEEFRRLVTEAHLGRDLSDSLAALADRVSNEDFTWVVQAIEIHRQVGGDLAEVLDNVSATIRDRNRIRRQIDALSGEGKLSAVILFVLPLGMIAVLQIVNPGYLSELTTTGLGQALIVVAGGLMLAGGVWMRRLTRLAF